MENLNIVVILLSNNIVNIFICLIVHLFLLYLDEININK